MQPEHATPQTTRAIKEVEKVDILTVSAVLVLAVAVCPVETAHPHKMLHVSVYLSLGRLLPCFSPTGGGQCYENQKAGALSCSGSHWRAPTQMPKAPPTTHEATLGLVCDLAL